MPRRGAVGFQAANRIIKLRDIYKALESSQDASYCSVHRGKELELYCETCEELICLRCAYKGDKHHSHDHQDVDKAFESFKEHILRRLEAPKSRLKSLLKAVEKRLVCEQTSGASGEHDSIKYHHTVLGGLRVDLETAMDKLTHILKFLRTRKLSKQVEVLAKKSKLLSGVAGVEEVIQRSCLILEGPDPSLCYLVRRDTMPVVGKKATIGLDVVNFSGSSFDGSLRSLQCVLISLETGAEVKCDVREGTIQYKIVYQPTVEGKHHLSVQVNGYHVRGSPYMLSVRLPEDRVAMGCS